LIRFLNAYFPARTVVLGVSEIFLTLLAFLAATIVLAGQESLLVLLYEHGIAKIVLAASVFALCMYYLDLYDTLVLSNRAEVISRLLQVCGVGTVILAFIYYAFPDAGMVRGIYFLGLLFLMFLLSCWRELYFSILRTFNLGQRALILGQSPLAASLALEVGSRSEVGINLLGYVDPGGEPFPMGMLHCLGTADELDAVVTQRHVQRIIIAVGDRRGRLPVEQLLSIKKNGVEVIEGQDLYESVTGKISLNSLRLGWLLFGRGFSVSRGMLLYKRVFSVILGFPAFVLSLPVMALAAVAIRLDSPGPAIYRQPRIGKDGLPFTCFKFRTLYKDADRLGNHAPVREHDDRVTRVGRWLRRTRIDELPQLYNILRGDMYFVGPRPFVPNQEMELAEEIPFYRQRWSVRPGATGWAQINRGYCATREDNEEKLSYDLYYIKNMSVGLDILILFKTIKILLLGRGGR
jgi:sugar transferase (PEP-CTERM system associated)